MGALPDDFRIEWGRYINIKAHSRLVARLLLKGKALQTIIKVTSSHAGM